MKKLLLIFLLLIPIASAFTSTNEWRVSTTTLTFDTENVSGTANIIDNKIENILARFWQRISDSTPPAEFNLSFPTNSTSSTDTTPILEWTNSSDLNFDKYVIEISNNSNFTIINYSRISIF